MNALKVVEDGRTYARTVASNGGVIIEKVDPLFHHDAPPSVPEGTSLTVTFIMRDFDGADRTDADGLLLLDIDGTELAVSVGKGRAELQLELFASATVAQKPPYLNDARFLPFTIEVTT